MGLWKKEQPKQQEHHNQYIKKQGDEWVVLNKEGEVISHHDSREKAEESFRAMEMNKYD